MAVAVARNSAAVAPMIWAPTIAAVAWPSRHAFTVWPKPETLSPLILRSMVMVEPHSLECAVAVASGPFSRSEQRNVRGQLQQLRVVDLVQIGHA